MHDSALGSCHLGPACRCGRLQTLVLVLVDATEDWTLDEHARDMDLLARLPALASGAPALRALQVVLPASMFDDWLRELRPLWRALEALTNLASLALGCFAALVDLPRHTLGDPDVAERIAGFLDASQVGSSSW